MKCVVWMGRSKEDLKALPVSVQQAAGFELHRVQIGQAPSDWKPMTTVGPGIREIRLKEASGAYRVLYVTSIGTQIYVLHCFQKKAQKTGLQDLRLAQERYRQIPR